MASIKHKDILITGVKKQKLKSPHQHTIELMKKFF